MPELSAERCVACRPDSPHITQAETIALLPSLPDWKLVTATGTRALQRTFRFRDFAGALTFANAIGAIAEEHNHHPDVLVGWGRATVTWTTHAIKDLHRNDFIMAAKTDRVYGVPPRRPS